MPRGPKGEKRPADVIGNAVHVMRIATGEAEDQTGKAPERAKGGRKGGKARSSALSPAMAAGLSQTLWSMIDLAEMVDAAQPKPVKRGTYERRSEA